MPKERVVFMSFREKSAAAILVTNVLVFGNYFLDNWDASVPHALWAFYKAVGISISVLIAAHIAIAIHSHLRKEDPDAAADERDGSQVAYYRFGV